MARSDESGQRQKSMDVQNMAFALIQIYRVPRRRLSIRTVSPVDSNPTELYVTGVTQLPGLFTILALVLKDVSIFVSYVKNNAFPLPLSAEEEQKCIARMGMGDGEARNQLIEHNLRLVAHLVKKFESTGEDPDDLISIGTIGLIKAVESYHAGRGTKLATFAARCVENEILMYLRSSRKFRRDAYLFDPIGVDKEGNEMTLVDLLGTDPDEVVDQVDLTWEKQKVYEYLPHLPNREREVICKRFGIPDGEEKTQREIAKELGISRSYVSRIERKALTKLYDEMRGGRGIGNVGPASP